MDIGAAGYAFSFGLMKGLKYEDRIQIMLAFRKSIPILIFGCLRLIFVKLSGYHEHVSEYGVHWNFFFTLFSLHSLMLLAKKWTGMDNFWCGVFLAMSTYFTFSKDNFRFAEYYVAFTSMQ
jgi:hypothetical protein